MNLEEAVFCDTPHAGGFFFINGSNLLSTLSGANALVFTRNALGDYSLNRTAGGAETYQVVTGVPDMRRLLESPNFQEAFGTAALGASSTGPRAQSGFPPFTGITQFNPLTTAPPKGLRIRDISVVYQVGVVDLTAASLSFNEAKFANNVANSIVNKPITATALPLVVQANPYLVTRTVTTPAFMIDDFADFNVEFSFTMANTGTIRVYGIGYHVDFNYN